MPTPVFPGFCIVVSRASITRGAGRRRTKLGSGNRLIGQNLVDIFERAPIAFGRDSRSIGIDGGCRDRSAVVKLALGR